MEEEEEAHRSLWSLYRTYLAVRGFDSCIQQPGCLIHASQQP